MFARFWTWVKSWFVSTEDVYHPSERLIYSYFDGAQTVRADPLVLWKRLMERGPELGVDLQVARSPSKDARKAHDGAVAKVREVFSLKGLSEGGLTEGEALELLDHYLEWCERLKKNSSPPATSPVATSAPTASSPAPVSPTEPSWVSGSTGRGPSTAAPEPSPSGPVSE